MLPDADSTAAAQALCTNGLQFSLFIGLPGHHGTTCLAPPHLRRSLPLPTHSSPCSALGCRDLECSLCQFNPTRVCERNYSKKYLVSSWGSITYLGHLSGAAPPAWVTYLGQHHLEAAACSSWASTSITWGSWSSWGGITSKGGKESLRQCIIAA